VFGEKMKNKILDKVSGEEALIILRKIAANDPKSANQIEEEAERLLKRIHLEDVCEDIYSALDGIDVEELFDRSGASRYGYSSPEDMAVEMMEDELEPYNEHVFKFLELGMDKEAKHYCMGVLKGIYKYEQESKSEFKKWAADVAGECFEYILEEWKRRVNNKNDLKDMSNFMKKECSKWAD
jgi:hypothetical protein